MFGECKEGFDLQFLRDEAVMECGFEPTLMTQQFCENTLSVNTFTNMFLSVYGRNISEIISPILGASRKFDLNDFSEQPISSLDFLTTTFTADSCRCENIALEGYYTVYYDSEMINNETDYFYIKNVTLDIVYGDYIPSSCSEQVYFSQKTSFQFKKSIFSRKTSGAPGYLKGSTLLAGSAISTPNGTYINSTQQGFRLSGADN
mmetsp:Transcript_31518/g.30840  ORF Transcript_31518/g.30840 Transcript_31518/m.30840 type:complete len:204 (-) Transcript_31518:669-1280(-)|eukprot:CAMPEP_0170548178 /NCGR_PEP_ID=MMETSP0211-20121228/6505_1 /TAXON_ID=311385 /ORGANISM="Pseudokeronopsis sp., Strain OXSARD2" /LENGTH=203 /DNA_ID=CAMNT_0010853577 /DNA_START=574 /DNA_END=1185 /DNA_ORIENTATION=+